MFGRREININPITRNINLLQDGSFFCYKVTARPTKNKAIYEVTKSIRKLDEYEIRNLRSHGNIVEVSPNTALLDNMEEEKYLVEFNQPPEVIMSTKGFPENILCLLQKDRIRQRLNTVSRNIQRAYFFYRAGEMYPQVIPRTDLYVGELFMEDNRVRRGYNEITGKESAAETLKKVATATFKTEFTKPYEDAIKQTVSILQEENAIFKQRVENFGGQELFGIADPYAIEKEQE